MTKPVFQMFGRDLEVAANGNPELMLELAHKLTSGWRGLAEDPARALGLVQAAAAMGHARAMLRLGDRYLRGDGLPKDHTLAMQWYRNAANAGNLDAMANLIPLADSTDLNEAAEGRHWLQIAASRGQPYAVHRAGGGATGNLAQFANLSLEQMAAGAPPASAHELSWEAEEVSASLPQINDAIGSWIERLRPVWPDVRVQSQVDGEDVDFPGPDLSAIPDGVSDDNSTIEVTIYGFDHHLQLDLTLWDEGWNLTLSSFEPHPPQQGQTWLVGELVATAKQLGIRLQ